MTAEDKKAMSEIFVDGIEIDCSLFDSSAEEKPEYNTEDWFGLDYTDFRDFEMIEIDN